MRGIGFHQSQVYPLYRRRRGGNYRKYCSGSTASVHSRALTVSFAIVRKAHLSNGNCSATDLYCDVSRAGPQELLYLLGERYISESGLLRKYLKPDMHVFDVGANIGYYLLLFCRCVGARGKVAAIEPSPENLCELELNVKINDFENVAILPTAVGSEARKIGLMSGINSGIADGEMAAYVVEQDTIDNLARNPVDFLKVDIEGYETSALKGARRVLSQDKPILFLEVHPGLLSRYGSSVKEVIEIVDQYYSDIELFEPYSPSGLVGKFIVNYFGGGVRPIHDRHRYVERETELRRPFWLIARPETSRS